MRHRHPPPPRRALARMPDDARDAHMPDGARDARASARSGRRRGLAPPATSSGGGSVEQVGVGVDQVGASGGRIPWSRPGVRRGSGAMPGVTSYRQTRTSEAPPSVPTSSRSLRSRERPPLLPHRGQVRWAGPFS